MPSRNPRIALTLKPELKKVFDDAADILGVKTTKLIVEVLEEAQGPIHEMAQAVHAAKSDPVKGLSGLKDMVISGRQDIAQAQIDLEDEIAAQSRSKDK